MHDEARQIGIPYQREEAPVILLWTGRDEADALGAFLEASRVRPAASRAEAEQIAAQESVDVLVFDMGLGSTPLEFYAEARSRSPWLVAVAIADYLEPLSLFRLQERGVLGPLVRPLGREQLVRLMEQALELNRVRREHARYQTLIPLYRLGERFLADRREEEILEQLLDVIQEQTGVRHISVMLYRREEGCLRVAAARGLATTLCQTIRIRPGDRIAGWVFATARPVLLDRDREVAPALAPLLNRPEIVSAICCPLVARGKVLGVVNVSSMEPAHRFSEADIELLAVICLEASLALENIRAMAELAEKVRLETLLQQYVAPEVARLLLESRVDPLELGEIREVAVLFADIRNFTGLVQELDLALLRRFLNEFFQIFTEEVYRHRGTVDKFMGDAVLVFFGAPVPVADSCRVGLEAAWAIRARFLELRRRLAPLHPDFGAVDLGIGLTQGRCFVGNVGSSRRLDYTVIGVQVNLAQRLAALADDSAVYVTREVQADVAGRFDFAGLGPVPIKGMQEAVEVFRVEGPAG